MGKTTAELWAEFREEEHPRDRTGKFRKKGGGTGGGVDQRLADADIEMVEYEHARMSDQLEEYNGAESPEERVEIANELKVSAEDIEKRMDRVREHYGAEDPGSASPPYGDDRDLAELEHAHAQMGERLQKYGAAESDREAIPHVKQMTYQARVMVSAADAVWKQEADEIEAAREAPKSSAREELTVNGLTMTVTTTGAWPIAETPEPQAPESPVDPTDPEKPSTAPVPEEPAEPAEEPAEEPEKPDDAAARAVSARYVGQLVTLAGRAWALRTEAMEALAACLNEGVFVTGNEVLRAETKPNAAAGGVAGPPMISVIPLTGLLTPGDDGGMFSFMFGGSGGLDLFRTRLLEAASDPAVEHIVLDVNSPGGLVDQVPETAAVIRAVAKRKNVIAVANSQMASAAYWLASQANEVVVTPSGDVGSVGVYMMHTDVSQAAKQAGVKVTLTSAGKYKTDGNQFEPLSPSAKKAVQEKVDTMYSMFAGDVAVGRGATELAVRNGYGEGRTVLAGAAVREGLADRIATRDEVIAGLIEDAGEARTQAAARRRRAALLL